MGVVIVPFMFIFIVLTAQGRQDPFTCSAEDMSKIEKLF